MQTSGGGGMGRFRVELDLANNGDLEMVRRGLMPPDQVRREKIEGLVDSGATKLVLPEAVVKRLGLPLGDPVKVRYADGRRARRREAEGVFVELLGRHGTFKAISEPRRETALVGVIVLEDLDLLVDGSQQRLVPRDPGGATFEIE